MQDLKILAKLIEESPRQGIALTANHDRRIQLAIAERLDGILTEMKAMNKPKEDFLTMIGGRKANPDEVRVDVSKTPTA